MESKISIILKFYKIFMCYYGYLSNFFEHSRTLIFIVAFDTINDAISK